MNISPKFVYLAEIFNLFVSAQALLARGERLLASGGDILMAGEDGEEEEEEVPIPEGMRPR